MSFMVKILCSSNRGGFCFPVGNFHEDKLWVFGTRASKSKSSFLDRDEHSNSLKPREIPSEVASRDTGRILLV